MVCLGALPLRLPPIWAIASYEKRKPYYEPFGPGKSDLAGAVLRGFGLLGERGAVFLKNRSYVAAAYLAGSVAHFMQKAKGR